ncbi:OmpH family outer membrane protein [Catalinimonas niigatensis]|uniref:OmpH family outer membrane protein n=1 Tax=Catalinimonas niigatensis TaxID=1397264 RepID=UPI0026661CE2|nr:OmpH family outer membrane protein [Catalinimonas niigatensis]WPP53475.1 OmpH family outer membrane protein [Catalinimonas niigatensis]
MKLKTLFVSAMLTLFAVGVQAQGNVKIAYVDTDYILAQMPEAKQIQSELQAYQRQLTNKIQATMQGLQQQYQEYQQGAATMTEQARQEKEQQLQELQQQIQQDQQEAQLAMQRKEGELLEPVYEKIQTNIDKVAEQNAYTHIFSAGVPGNPILLYVKNKEEADISDMILQAMGITPTTGSSGTGTDGSNNR